jgi:hypothetical protein
MSKVVHWLDFVRFINDQDLWTRWTYTVPFNEDGSSPEKYFIDAVEAAKQKRTLASFDFDKTNITLTSRDESTINWEHDGESLWYFFQKWYQGVRV